ncbi:OLC1v1024975C1 [Oldenlandia corymbosa var. corymbosa]|uniref:OLC1v1024975C1 n=1 Tax=Oldenlandia corymbosa var. corymbosa TaxID=529605 RepID=A0AAV1C3M4_OLDCO|nr:OLC1v1024975C1 [Oldenlandia corymbosa var. corymbosa]
MSILAGSDKVVSEPNNPRLESQPNSPWPEISLPSIPCDTLINYGRPTRKEIFTDIFNLLEEIRGTRGCHFEAVNSQSEDLEISEPKLPTPSKELSPKDSSKMVTPPSWIELLRFSGDNPEAWLQNCNEYFSILSIPESNRLEMIKPYLEEVAEILLEAMMMLKPNMTWLEFSKGLVKRFKEKNEEAEIHLTLGSRGEERGNSIIVHAMDESNFNDDEYVGPKLTDDHMVSNKIDCDDREKFDELLKAVNDDDNLSRNVDENFMILNDVDDDFLIDELLFTGYDDNNSPLDSLVHDFENLNGAGATLMSATVNSCDEEVSNVNLVDPVALEDNFLFMDDIVFDETPVEEDGGVDSECLTEERADVFLVYDALLNSDVNVNGLLEKVYENSVNLTVVADDRSLHEEDGSVTLEFRDKELMLVGCESTMVRKELLIQSFGMVALHLSLYLEGKDALKGKGVVQPHFALFDIRLCAMRIPEMLLKGEDESTATINLISKFEMNSLEMALNALDYYSSLCKRFYVDNYGEHALKFFIDR